MKNSGDPQFFSAGAALILLSACGNQRGMKSDFTTRYLVAGQSNAASHDEQSRYTFGRTGLTAVNDYYADLNRPVEAQGGFIYPSAVHPTIGNAVWLALGDLLKRPLFFRNVARGGRSSRKMIEQVLPRMLYNLRLQSFDAILWVQGESDYFEGLSASETYQNTRFIIEETRKVQPGIPWYLVKTSGGLGENATRLAQENLIQEGLVLRGPDLDLIRDGCTTCVDITQVQIQAFAKAWHEILGDVE